MTVKTKLSVIGAALLGLSACVDGAGTLAPLPEEVAALAAPAQDLSTARLLAEDGCYWYLHRGPVETTLLPLRTAKGSPICVARTE
jgi:hypothetical protein